MSSSSDEEESLRSRLGKATEAVAIEDPDENTIRVLVSTDNHLGYCEEDPVRGMDSFAALEEVLWLARHFSADMVLLAGDLFHHNKPSRGTIHRTMDLFRRYCMGDNPIQIQILSNQQQNFRRGLVNYQDSNYSVDLPVFSIHGNHDDPTREVGTSDLFCALDLLDVANLVNYFGRQEKIEQVQVSPILMKKGDTHLALYGLGSMRDERLHRMWRQQKLKFLRPEQSDIQWFNLFALHQNRDRGRGAKNCVQETMIPEWMDFVVWGHEHECVILPNESTVGTFRISQPGSSVATSLSAGEAELKHAGILDIKGGQFRLLPMPLTQVRSFLRGEINLAQEKNLDPDDHKVDQKVSAILDERVKVLIHDAREKINETLERAEELGNSLAGMVEKELPLKYKLRKPDEVLVRLNVDHSGFSVMNNQRFGAKFVGQVANPTDILLYNRKKATSKNKNGSKKLKLLAPIEPADLAVTKIDDLVLGELDDSEKKLELFDEKRITNALDNYVEKQEAQAIAQTIEKLLDKQQKKLMAQKGDDEEENFNANGRRSRKLKVEMKDVELEDNESSPHPKRTTKSRSTKRATEAVKKRTRGRSTTVTKVDDSEDDDESSQDASLPPKRFRASRKTTKRSYKDFDSDDDSDDDDVDVDDYAIEVIDDDDEEMSPSPSLPKKRSKGTASLRARSSRSKSGASTSESVSRSQLSFEPAQRKTRKAASRKKYTDSSDEEEFTASRSFDLEDGWGTAKTSSFD